jgi:hypothetical protein
MSYRQAATLPYRVVGGAYIGQTRRFIEIKLALEGPGYRRVVGCIDPGLLRDTVRTIKNAVECGKLIPPEYVEDTESVLIRYGEIVRENRCVNLYLSLIDRCHTRAITIIGYTAHATF